MEIAEEVSECFINKAIDLLKGDILMNKNKMAFILNIYVVFVLAGWILVYPVSAAPVFS